jgi:hypothetical protein
VFWEEMRITISNLDICKKNNLKSYRKKSSLSEEKFALLPDLTLPPAKSEAGLSL